MKTVPFVIPVSDFGLSPAIVSSCDTTDVLSIIFGR